jgi:glycosyltransferase involved in cell wall biosynthesis
MRGDSATLVSVVLPAYNAAKFLAQTLESVLSQSYGNFEVLLVDDGSSDQTAAIARQFAAQDSRLQVIQQPNAGVAAARNVGIAQAQGGLIAPIDADDLWQPDYLHKMVTKWSQSPPQVGVIYAWSEDIDGENQLTGGYHVATIGGNVYPLLLCHNFLGNASATLMRRDLLVQIGGYDVGMRAAAAQGCEDWDLYLRLAVLCEFAVVPEFLVGYRKLASSMSGDGAMMARSQAMMLDRQESTGPIVPGWYYQLSRSSFYLYLAHQTRGQTEKKHWLTKARQDGGWATMLRPGWYVMQWQLYRRNSHIPPPKLGQSKVWLKVWGKIWITTGLHWVLSKFT